MFRLRFVCLNYQDVGKDYHRGDCKQVVGRCEVGFLLRSGGVSSNTSSGQSK
nr:MAG TPA: hypothetical protein [Caudoviricetes sp.]